jgi:ketosteroid isomerase-like protein
MSPSENVELTRRAYQAFNDRDWRAFAELTDPDIEVESRLVAMEGGYRGQEGLRDWREAIMSFLPDYRVEIEEIRDLGDIVVARSVGTGHGATSETPVHDPFWQVLEWRGGKCVWWRNCSTEAEANEAIAARTATGG